MTTTKNWLTGKKTYIVAALLVLVSLVNFLTGDMTFIEFVTSPDMLILLNALGIGSIRHAIK